MRSVFSLALLAGVLFTHSALALNICTMTFNSTDEKAALEKVYAQDPSAKFIELVPTNNDPHWLQNACRQKVSCDVLLISGHFGGLFFGEKTIPTLSLEDMFKQSCEEKCPGVFENVKSVYLMGCNTLASKKADHRTPFTYMQALVYDGFPLENAELVATARYTRFGESIENKMRMIFPKAEVIFGFDSTAPKGAIAGPLFAKALAQSSTQDLATIGASPKALREAFKSTNALMTRANAEMMEARSLRCDLQSASPSPSATAKAFAAKQVRKNFDVAMSMTNLESLKDLFQQQPSAAKEIQAVAKDIFEQSHGMPGVQTRVLKLLRQLQLMPETQYQNFVTQTFNDFYSEGLDYLRAEQLCGMAETTPELSLPTELANTPANFDSYKGVIASCFQNPRGQFFQNIQITGKTEVERCLIASNGQFDWFCLTKTPDQINLNACLFAAQRNPDITNGDNMRWYCWDQLRRQMRISPSQCLALSKSFRILGNRIKSNWNCMNTLSRPY